MYIVNKKLEQCLLYNSIFMVAKFHVNNLNFIFVIIIFQKSADRLVEAFLLSFRQILRPPQGVLIHVRQSSTFRGYTACPSSGALHVYTLAEQQLRFARVQSPRCSADFSPELSAIPTWGKEADSGRKTRMLAGTTETPL